jgi:signal transduction histidine kinase
LDQSTVLIISDEAEFSSAVTGRWQAERSVPSFTLMRGDLCQDLDPETFDAAIVGGVRARILPKALHALEPAGKPVLLICDDSQALRKVRERHPRSLVLRQSEGWLDAAVLLLTELLRGRDTLARLAHAERENAFLQRQAALGGYMLEMRHTLNNSLTSVLGNSELLLLEAGAFSAETRSQIETIRNMSLRMHEILQRFSSLEKEMRVVEKQEARETSAKRRSAAAGR